MKAKQKTSTIGVKKRVAVSGSPYAFSLGIAKILAWLFMCSVIIIFALIGVIVYLSTIPNREPFYVYVTKEGIDVRAYSSRISASDAQQILLKTLSEYISRRERTYYYRATSAITAQDGRFIHDYSSPAEFNKYRSLFNQEDKIKTISITQDAIERNVRIATIVRLYTNEETGISTYKAKATFDDLIKPNGKKEVREKVDVTIELKVRTNPNRVELANIEHINPLGIEVVSYSIISDANTGIIDDSFSKKLKKEAENSNE